MPLFSRCDGDPIPNLSPTRRTMALLMKGRNEAAVTFEQQVALDETLAWLERTNTERPEQERVSFFHVLLAAAVRALAQRPRLNRFVVAGRIYQRRAIELSFAVKKALTDEAGMTMVKVRFEPQDSLQDVRRRVDEAIAAGRATKLTASEREMAMVTRLPHAVQAALVWLMRWADRHNLLPASMIEADPLYTSVALANLGSIGLDAAYHHLYEHGTATLFAVVGRIRTLRELDAAGRLLERQVVTVKHTFDERVADGLYCARALQLFQEYVEQPGQLDEPPPA